MPDKLNESALNEATLPIQVFGMELVSCVMCNLWYSSGGSRGRALGAIAPPLC